MTFPGNIQIRPNDTVTTGLVSKTPYLLLTGFHFQLLGGGAQWAENDDQEDLINFSL